jgi:hypothetical protein
MAKIILVPHKGVTVGIKKIRTLKGGTHYTEYQITHYLTGKRARPTRANLEEAKGKAREIAEAMVAGKREVLDWDEPQRLGIRKALEALKPTGTRIDRAANLIADALKLLPEDEILAACRYWRDNGPGNNLKPKLVKPAIYEYCIRREGSIISVRRRRTNRSYLRSFEKAFGDRLLHEITSLEISDWSSGKRWSPITRNDVLGTISLFFKDCVLRSYALKNSASSEAIKRQKVRSSNVGIFMPEQARKLLNSIDECLRPFFALWSFSGLRKEEAARISWDQVDAGLQSGSIYLRADQAKPGEARSLPLTASLRAWLMAYRKPTGTVLPEKWQGMSQMDDLANTMSRQAKLEWVKNGPRHSFGTFHLKLHGDPALTVRVMGTSLNKFQRHYGNRSETVTKAVAAEWFNIFPDATADVIPMPRPDPGCEQAAAVSSAL